MAAVLQLLPSSEECALHLTTKRAPIAFAGLSMAIAIAGCGGAATLNNPSQSVSNGIYKAVGQRPASVSCPSNIPVKTGHTFTCTIADSTGQKLPATVTETSVSGTTAQIHISVAK
jgi:hypothetical protein